MDMDAWERDVKECLDEAERFQVDLEQLVGLLRAGD